MFSEVVSNRETQGANRWLALGFVGRPHGLKGAFFVGGRDSQFPKELKEVLIGEELQTASPTKIKVSHCQSGTSVVLCERIPDRNTCEQYRGRKLWGMRSCIKVHDDEFLWDDVTGLNVEDSEGFSFGQVREVQNFGATDIVMIEGERGCVDIPLVSSYFHMNFSQKILHMKLPISTFDDTWY